MRIIEVTCSNENCRHSFYVSVELGYAASWEDPGKPNRVWVADCPLCGTDLSRRDCAKAILKAEVEEAETERTPEREWDQPDTYQDLDQPKV